MTLKNLNNKLVRIDHNSHIKEVNSRRNTMTRIIVAAVLILLLVGLPVLMIINSVKKTSSNLKILSALLKQPNLTQIEPAIINTYNSLNDLNSSLKWLIWIQPIPFIGGYYSDARHLAYAATLDLKAVGIMVDQLKPYQNELGLAGQLSPGQDRIAQMVTIIGKIMPQINQVEPLLHQARQEVSDIDTSKYPVSFRGITIRSKVDLAKQAVMGADVLLNENRSLVEQTPSALGSDTPKTYLLLFQNDKELRATGGFITAYAFLSVNKGKISTSSSDDIYRLDERLIEVCQSKICPLKPPDPIVRYLPEVSGKPRGAWSMRDSNLSPDLPTSVKQFETMYQMLGNGLPFDGIITIDTNVVEELISITGPIDVFGTTYSSNTDKRCNCPNVVYELEHYSEIAAKGETDRKAVVGTLMQQILTRSLAAGPDQLPSFIQTGINLANEKHIMFYMHNKNLETALSKLNWTGEIKQTEGDYLHINDSNFAGGKSNLYVEEKVTMEINIDGFGQAKNKITIEYSNPQPYNTWLNGINRDYVRLYAPLGSKLISSNGSDEPVRTQTDQALSKTYFEAFITVNPQNYRKLSFEYALPKPVSGKSYPLLIQKQPGTKDYHYIVKINGKNKAEFNLTTDKEFNLTF